MARHPSYFTVSSLLVVLLLVVATACGTSAPSAPTAAPAPTTAAKAAPAPAPTTAAAVPAPVATAAPAPAAAAPTAAPAAAPAKVTEYNVPVFGDASGPTGDIVKVWDVGRKAAFAWWNDTRGKQLGIKLNTKHYDTRYDTSQIASLWPGVLNDKPLLSVGQGSLEVTALAQRLMTDKVPMFLGGGGFGATWKPDQWVFHAQATYSQHMAGFVNWKISTWQESRPLRVGLIVIATSPTMFEVAGIFKTLSDKNFFGSKLEYVGSESVPAAPTDMSNEVKRLLDKKADVIIVLHTTNTIALAKRAMQGYSSTAKLGLAGAGFASVEKALGSLKDFEGDYETGDLASNLDTDIEAYKVFKDYNGKPAVGTSEWSNPVIVGMANVALPLAAVERAAKAVGPDKLTSQAIYDAVYSGPFTSREMLGLTGDLTFGKDAAFPTKGVKVRVLTVKDGKVQRASDWLAAPDVPKP